MHWFKSCLVGFAVFVTSLYYQGAARAQGLPLAAAGKVVGAVQEFLSPPEPAVPEIPPPNLIGCPRVARTEAYDEYIRALLEDLQKIREGLNGVEQFSYFCAAVPTVTDVPADSFKSCCDFAKERVVERCQAAVLAGAKAREDECRLNLARLRPFRNMIEKIRGRCCEVLQPQGLAVALQFCESEAKRFVGIACSNLDDDPKLTSNQ